MILHTAHYILEKKIMHVNIYKGGDLHQVFEGTVEEWEVFDKTNDSSNAKDSKVNVANPNGILLYHTCFTGEIPTTDSPLWKLFIDEQENNGRLFMWSSPNERLRVWYTNGEFLISEFGILQNTFVTTVKEACDYISARLCITYTIAGFSYFINSEFKDLIYNSENGSGWVSPSGNIRVSCDDKELETYILHYWGIERRITLIHLAELLSNLHLDLAIFKTAYKLQCEKLNSESAVLGDNNYEN